MVVVSRIDRTVSQLWRLEATVMNHNANTFGDSGFATHRLRTTAIEEQTLQNECILQRGLIRSTHLDDLGYPTVFV